MADAPNPSSYESLQMAKEKKKKKKRSMQQVHRQVQDAVQALPYAVEEHRKQGRTFKAAVLRYVSAPMLRGMNKLLNAGRYRGTEGEKTRQSEQMRRHLDQKRQAMQHVQSQMKEMQKRRRAK